MDSQKWIPEADGLSYIVSSGPSGVDGLCCNYELRRHRYEHLADEGAQSCRDDWVKYIGPLERWGCCNPWEGNFGSVVLPFCKPERLALMSYIFECMYGPLTEPVVDKVSDVRIHHQLPSSTTMF